jgi:hypothetical protein
MPAGDGTGPAGLGPMTGRAAGYCAGYSVPGYMNPVWGGYGRFPRGGRGFYGRGRGWRNWYWATGLPGWMRAGYGAPAAPMWSGPGAPYPAGPEMTAEQEMDMLKKDAEMLRAQLEEVQERIGTLEKAKEKEKK